MPTKRSPKAPLPEVLIWWRHLKRHPLNEMLGIEVKVQRLRRGWSLRDVADLTGIAKSHLWDLERGGHTVSLDRMEALDAAFCVVPGTLLALARRRLHHFHLSAWAMRSV